MQLTELSAVLIALGVVLALAVLVMLVWRGRVRRLNGENPEERYRRDIRAVRRGRRFGPEDAALEMSGPPGRRRTPRIRGPRRPGPPWQRG